MANNEHNPSSMSKLMKFSQIVSIVDADIEFLTENLITILNSVDPNEFPEDIPVAFVGVIGQTGSGKSILTSFLLEYLTAEEKGGWLTNIVRRNNAGELIKGFPFGDMCSSTASNSGKDTAPDGIYLWPELFPVTPLGGTNKIAVCVLQIYCPSDDKYLTALEQLLVVLCSRIMEIRWTNRNIRLLDHIHVLAESDPNNTTFHLCKSFNYIVRTVNAIKSEIGSSAINQIAKWFQDDNERLLLYQHILNGLDNINLSSIKDIAIPLTNEEGFFNRDVFKRLKPQLQDIIEDMMDESEVVPKEVGNETWVTLKSMNHFLEEAVKDFKKHQLTHFDAHSMPHLKKDDYNTLGENTAPEVPTQLLDPVSNYDKHNVSDHSVTVHLKSKDDSYENMPSTSNVVCKSTDNYASGQIPDSTVAPKITPKKFPRSTKKPNEGGFQDLTSMHSKTNQQAKTNILTPETQRLADNEKEIRPTLRPTAKARRETKSQGPSELDNQMYQQFNSFNNTRFKSNYSPGNNLRVIPQARSTKVQSLDASHQISLQSRPSKKTQLSLASQCQDNCETNPSQSLNEQKFKTLVENWVNHHSKLETVDQIEYFFKNMSLEILRNDIDESFRAIGKQHLENISKYVLGYMKPLKMAFREHGFLPAHDLSASMQRNLKLLMDHLGPGFDCDIVCIAVQNFMALFTDYNNHLIKMEERTLIDARNYVLDTYHEEMRKYFSFGSMDVSVSDAIHNNVATRLVSKYVKAIYSPLSFANNLGELSGKLKQDLDRAYDNILIERLIVSLKKVMLSVKTQYNTLITAVLDSHQNGLDPGEMNRVHEEIKVKILKLLLREIRSKVRENEPFEQHKLCILNYIENYWPAVVEANAQKLRSSQKNQGQLQELKNEDNVNFAKPKRRNSQRVKSIIEEDKSFASNQLNKEQEQAESDSELKVIIFHLQSPNVSMAVKIKGKTDLLPNEYGEQYTPGCVALTSDQKFIYGTEALARSRITGDCNWVWHIADFFENLQNHRKVYSAQSKKYEIFDNFLLAYLMKKLKKTVEDRDNIFIETAVVVVPIWLTKFQRNQISDAGDIVGLSKIRFISEPSAAAFTFSLFPKYGDGYVMVLCESLQRVEVLLYEYSSTKKTTRCIGIAGNYMDGSPEKISRINPSEWKFVKNYQKISSKHPSDYDLAKDYCKNALKMVKQKVGMKIVLDEFVFIVGDKKNWGTILEELSHKFINNISKPGGGEVMMNGAVEFSKLDENERGFPDCQKADSGTSSSSNPIDDDIFEMRSLLDMVTKTAEENRISVDEFKQTVLNKIENMLVHINTGNYHIKSSFVKDLLISKILKAKEETLRESVTYEEVQEQMSILESICNKYAPN